MNEMTVGGKEARKERADVQNGEEGGKKLLGTNEQLIQTTVSLYAVKQIKCTPETQTGHTQSCLPILVPLVSSVFHHAE